MNLQDICTPQDNGSVAKSYESILSATSSGPLAFGDAPNTTRNASNTTNSPQSASSSSITDKHSVTSEEKITKSLINKETFVPASTPQPASGDHEVSVVTPFLVKHIEEKSKIPKDNYHKYCYRHNPEITCNKSTDEARMKKIQSSLDKLPSRDQEAITHVWSIFSASPSQHRELILQGLLSQCCFPQLSFISQEVSSLIRIDFISTLPMEISLKILCYLDCRSLCNAAQVSRKWKAMADDDRVWHHMCEQHIDRKCPNCGWGLPLMHMKRAREMTDDEIKPIKKRDEENTDGAEGTSQNSSQITEIDETVGKKRKNSNPEEVQTNKLRRRPWKSVYSERFKLEKNWRKGIYTIKTFAGHTDGVTCLQFNRKYLMTGSYDATIKIWKVETGECVKTLSGHTKGVRTLVFDSQKLITGGLDSTIKVWNYHTGQCIATYRGHEGAVVSVDFCNKSIVSGSADHTIKVWHVDSRTCYTLRGHTDWVNCVKIHPASNSVFSASDDTTIRMWDLQSNQCLRIFGGMDNNGHSGQVQCVIPFTYKEQLIRDSDESDGEARLHNAEGEGESSSPEASCDPLELNPNYPTHLISCSLDNTIKLWCVRTGKCIRTQFGHIEGVWSINADTFRIISGAQDRLIKVWDLQNGKCLHTFATNSYVTCVGLSDSKFAAGLENGLVKMYSFE